MNGRKSSHSLSLSCSFSSITCHWSTRMKQRETRPVDYMWWNGRTRWQERHSLSSWQVLDGILLDSLPMVPSRMTCQMIDFLTAICLTRVYSSRRQQKKKIGNRRRAARVKYQVRKWMPCPMLFPFIEAFPKRRNQKTVRFYERERTMGHL